MSISPTRRTARSGRSPASKAAAAALAPSLKQAVLYARVSSREQEREGFSIPAQQAILKKYAADNGFAVLEEFIDVETAKKTGRVAFTRLLAMLKKKGAKAPVVLVEKTDRLYRNLKDWVALDEMKVDIHFVKEGIVLSDESRSSEKFIHGIKVLMAKNYVDNLSEEVKKGMVQKCEEGHYPGAAPIGYLNRREQGKSQLVVDPEKALLVRNLFELYDRGDHSVEGLAAYAAKAGLKGRNGGTLGKSVIHSLLRNPLYAGQFHWGGAVYAGKDPAIIRWEVFERVQARLDGHPYTRARELTFAYTGMITCGHCGAAITAQIKKEKYIYYHCARYCGTGMMPEAKLSAQWLREVSVLTMPEHLVAAVKKALTGSRQEIELDVSARVAAATARMDRLGKLVNAAYEDKLEGRIDNDFFNAKRAEWEQQRGEAAEEIQRLARVSSQNLDTAILVLELANRAYDLLSSREPLQQRRLLEVLCLNSTFTDGQLSVTFRKPFDVLAQWPKSEKENGGNSDDQNGHRSEWSGWANAYRTAALDPEVCSVERRLWCEAELLPGHALPGISPRWP
jgi:DNA invertase Pin-like site-specific DNA recombinase